MGRTDGQTDRQTDRDTIEGLEGGKAGAKKDVFFWCNPPLFLLGILDPFFSYLRKNGERIS